ncbi:MAG: CinA family nicotinamide mononucleotide deamidase-related protein [Candidatus Latescibacteria bacterium]|nr:CinA family nicotinamide mononucleotide deamidase-related protein [Candidatus Latescibacterota bacterium]
MQRHDVEVLLLGNELLRGERRDAHLAFVAQVAQRAGARVDECHAVGDDVAAIASKVRERLPRTRVLVVTGGLGPTDDDVTREGVAEAIGAPLEFREDAWREIEAFMSARGRTATEANRRQAHFPRGADILVNSLGTAPGFALAADGAHVFVLPGPPRELQPMMESLVLPKLLQVFGREPLRVETLRTVGIAESQLFEMLEPTTFALTAYSVSWVPSIAGVDVVLTEKRDAPRDRLDAEAQRVHERMTEVLGSKYYERGARPLALVVGETLRARRETLAVAESLTGGTIARLVTEHAGSSDYFLASAVAYANESKTAFLGVRAETIEQFGAVSEETCTEMAHGARRRANATYGVATTGIAGPGGGTPHKPVGLVFIGVAWDGGSQIKRVIYPGDRAAIRDRAAHGAMWLVHDRLVRTPEK